MFFLVNNLGYSRKGTINIDPLLAMQELYVGHGSAPVLVAYLRVPTSHCPHGPGMDNFEIVLNDYADDNLGEDTPSSNALWSQAFGPDPTSARPDAGIPQQPQQLSAATHTAAGGAVSAPSAGATPAIAAR